MNHVCLSPPQTHQMSLPLPTSATNSIYSPLHSQWTQLNFSPKNQSLCIPSHQFSAIILCFPVSTKTTQWVSVYLVLNDHLRELKSQKVFLQSMLEMIWGGFWFLYHTWTNLLFRSYWVIQNKNLDILIQRVVSQFRVRRMCSWMSLLAWIGYSSC